MLTIETTTTTKFPDNVRMTTNHLLAQIRIF